MKDFLRPCYYVGGFLLITAACPPLGLIIAIALICVMVFGNIVDFFNAL